MMRDDPKTPAYWVDELARADDDIACGRVVPSDGVLSELRAELADLEAQMAAEAADLMANTGP